MTSQISKATGDQSAIMQSLLQRVQGYVPELVATPGAKVNALLDVPARYCALLEIGAEGVPDRNLLALLDTLAIPLLSALAARVPLVFQLTPNCPVDVTVSAESQVAAQLPPPPPSPLAYAAARRRRWFCSYGAGRYPGASEPQGTLQRRSGQRHIRKIIRCN